VLLRRDPFGSRFANASPYGSFHRSIPLPEGTIADGAKASFDGGVLEVTRQAPARDVSRDRRVNLD